LVFKGAGDIDAAFAGEEPGEVVGDEALTGDEEVHEGI
jgi:hypothetical protein